MCSCSCTSPWPAEVDNYLVENKSETLEEVYIEYMQLGQANLIKKQMRDTLKSETTFEKKLTISMILTSP